MIETKPPKKSHNAACKLSGAARVSAPPPNRTCLVLTLLLVALAIAGHAEVSSKVPPSTGSETGDASQDFGSLDQVKERADALRRDVEAIPQSAEEGSLDARRKAALLELIGILDGYPKEWAKSDALAAQQNALEERSKAAKEALRAVESQLEIKLPANPTPDGFEALSAAVSKERTDLDALKSALTDLHARQEDAPRRMSDLRKRVEEIDQRIGQLAQDTGGARDASEKALVEIRTEAAKTKKQASLLSMKVIEAQTAYDKLLEPILAMETEAGEARVHRIEDEFDLYESALQEDLAVEQQQRKEDLERKEASAAQADSATQQILLDLDTARATSMKNQSELKAYLVSIKKDAAEQEKRLASEKSELESLNALVTKKEVSPEVTQRLRRTLELLQTRRKILNRSLQATTDGTLAGYRSRRFDIESALLEIPEHQMKDRETAKLSLPEAEQKTFNEQLDTAYTEYRASLRDEKGLLTEAINLGQQMQDLTLARLENLAAADRFIRSRSLWLRDGKSIVEVVTGQLRPELRSISAWLHARRTPETESFWRSTLYSPSSVFLAVVALVLLPLLLYYLHRRTRNYVELRQVSREGAGHVVRSWLWASLLSLLGASVLPVYLLVTAGTLALTGFPEWLILPGTTLMKALAGFTFGWFLIHSFLGRQGIFARSFLVPQEASRALRLGFSAFLAAYLLLCVSGAILQREPFELQAIPRLLYTGYLLALAGGVFLLLVVLPQFVEFAIGALNSARLRRIWPLIRVLVLALAAFTVGLDAAGYRFASAAFLKSFTMTMIVTLVFVPLSLSIAAILRRLAGDAGNQGAGGETTPDTPPPGIDTQVERFTRIFLLLVYLAAVAMAWGVDEQALDTLREIHVYTLHGVGDQPEYVTGADLFWFFTYIGMTVWLLRHLPGIYEFAIFPRITVDAGAKYAILTMSRYGIFAIGFMMALSRIHLDLGRLGWLIAAIGVGLGFGLQEIVSNFVSGIILLVERPIRINDIVTIGDISGSVRRINIRATTIQNWDCQEVVLPNRNLVTQSVTNWTRGDTVNRVMIEIGVAYGSDVDLVTRLLLELAAADPDILEEPAPIATFAKHGDSALEFVLRVFIPSPSVKLGVVHRMNKAINETFRDKGIEIPFPQRDIHIRSGADTLPDR